MNSRVIQLLNSTRDQVMLDLEIIHSKIINLTNKVKYEMDFLNEIESTLCLLNCYRDDGRTSIIAEIIVENDLKAQEQVKNGGIK